MKGVPQMRWKMREAPLCPGKVEVSFFQVGWGWAHHAFIPRDDVSAWCAAQDIHPVPVVEAAETMRGLGKALESPRFGMIGGTLWLEIHSLEFGMPAFPPESVTGIEYDPVNGRYFPCP